MYINYDPATGHNVRNRLYVDGSGSSIDVTFPQDNCIYEFNPDQVDHDVDNKGDECDNCEYDKNENQENNDDDKQGDVCDSDDDNDNVCKYWSCLRVVLIC